jgi:hypothetical protein
VIFFSNISSALVTRHKDVLATHQQQYSLFDAVVVFFLFLNADEVSTPRDLLRAAPPPSQCVFLGQWYR